MTTEQTVAAEIERRKMTWRKFMTPGAPGGFLFHVYFTDNDPNLPPAPLNWPDRAADRVEFSWKRYQQGLRRVAAVADDWIPSLSMVTGTEIFAEAFGCKVHRPADNQPFALPLIRSAREVAALKVPDLGASSLAYLFDMADELKRRGGPDALLQMADIQSPMDIAALIWEKASFYVGLVESPEAVKELAGKVRQLLAAFLDEWYRRYGVEFIGHCPYYLMPRGITLSEDEIGSVSADMFAEFFRPELEFLSTRYGGLGMHCCADARHQWGNIRSLPGLRLLNLFNPPTRPAHEYIKDAFSFFAGTCVQMHYGWTPEGTPAEQPFRYPAESRVVIDLWVDTRDEAARLADSIRALSLAKACP